VTAGLYISWNGLKLISAEPRLQAFLGDFLIYLTEGFVFLITGACSTHADCRIHGDSLSI